MQASTPIVYTCPMHPEVRQDHPGRCPKCQMHLVPEGEVSHGHPHDHRGHSMHPAVPVPADALGASQPESGGTIYTCPMHPEVRQDYPGRCPKCQMHLVPEGEVSHGHPHDHRGHSMHAAEPVPANALGTTQPEASGTIYTCPMHPEVRQDHPGTCPKCGMTLEPIIPLDEEDNHELLDFQRRFWWTLPLTVVVTILAMFGHRLGWFDMKVQTWVELVLSLPVVFWTGWPFFVRGWQSVVHRSPNMWTVSDWRTHIDG